MLIQKEELIKLLVEDPLSGILHLQYADYSLKTGNYYLAYAELKTAETLGIDHKLVESKLQSIRQLLPSLTSMNHNQYFRFVSLASEIIERAGSPNVSILDVGGGDGQLASFLPEASYCLAEPTVNGISGTNLPFPDHFFDYVVSCHVLEHIPIEERTNFLDQLMNKARRGVILLNPFYIKNTYVEDRIKLVIKLIGAEWAREHLDCIFPNIEEIKDYANNKGLEICIKPNGTLTTSMAFVFIDYFAAKSGLQNEWEELNKFFNEKYTAILDSDEYPNAYIIYLDCPKAI